MPKEPVPVPPRLPDDQLEADRLERGNVARLRCDVDDRQVHVDDRLATEPWNGRGSDMFKREHARPQRRRDQVGDLSYAAGQEGS